MAKHKHTPSERPVKPWPGFLGLSLLLASGLTDLLHLRKFLLDHFGKQQAIEWTFAVKDRGLGGAWAPIATAWPGHPEWIRKFLEVLGTKIEP